MPTRAPTSRCSTGPCALRPITRRADLAGAARHLAAGGVVAFPTDTVAGLGCLAASRRGVAAIFRLKARGRDKPLVLFVRSVAEAGAITGPLAAPVRRLLASCWPGPLTAVLRARGRLPAGLGRAGTIGVRIPAHPVPLALMRLVGGPLAATSANLTGRRPFREAREAGARWPGRVLALPGRGGTVPSTVVDLTVWPPRVLRSGALSARKLARLAVRAERAARRARRRVSAGG